MSVTDAAGTRGTSPNRNGCGHEVPDGSPVYLWWESGPGYFGPRVRMRRGCEECAAASLVRPPETMRAIMRRLSGALPDVSRAECPGCGRDLVVVRLTRSGALSRPRYCSDECRSVSRATTPNRNACACCGGPLAGKRSDARYCTGACRQRAYRER